MTELFRTDITVYATAYVRAKSAEEADRIVNEQLKWAEVTLSGCEVCPIDDGPFKQAPDLSLSPAATVAEVPTEDLDGAEVAD